MTNLTNESERRRVSLIPMPVDVDTAVLLGSAADPVDVLRRRLKSRRGERVYVYWNNLRVTGALLTSNFPMNRKDLVGAYTSNGLTNARLRDDLFGVEHEIEDSLRMAHLSDVRSLVAA